MTNKIFYICLFITLSLISSYAQNENEIISEEVENKVPDGILKGTLVYNNSDHPVPLVVMISGSGPTDRDGNQQGMGSDCFKMLADALIENEIASIRFDKRMVGQSTEFTKPAEETLFDDLAADIRAWIRKYEADPRFSSIFVMGHSLGALMGAVAIQETNTAGYLSVAGPGLPLHETMIRQLNDQSPFLANGAKPVLDSLANGHKVKEVHPLLQTIAPQHLQNYMISVFRQDPRKVYKSIDIPVIVINGTTDIQVSIEDANLLHDAAPDSELVIIEGMNHVLKNAPADRMENLKVYNDNSIPLNDEFVEAFISFIMENK